MFVNSLRRFCEIVKGWRYMKIIVLQFYNLLAGTGAKGVFFCSKLLTPLPFRTQKSS